MHMIVVDRRTTWQARNDTTFYEVKVFFTPFNVPDGTSNWPAELGTWIPVDAIAYREIVMGQSYVLTKKEAKNVG